MKELWLKKTIYRRYLIDESDVEAVKTILKNEPEKAENLIGNIYDRNQKLEYDDEKLVLPIDYNINNSGGKK